MSFFGGNMSRKFMTIQDMIYEIRGYKVMLDRDLANLYGVELRSLNQAVKRNIGRFPPEFMFQLKEKEYDNLRSQIATSSLKSKIAAKNLMSQIVTSSWGGRRKLPFAFTEHGVIMLSSVLNSKIKKIGFIAGD
jgi:hypothetical protein